MSEKRVEKKDRWVEGVKNKTQNAGERETEKRKSCKLREGQGGKNEGRKGESRRAGQGERCKLISLARL